MKELLAYRVNFTHQISGFGLGLRDLGVWSLARSRKVLFQDFEYVFKEEIWVEVSSIVLLVGVSVWEFPKIRVPYFGGSL